MSKVLHVLLALGCLAIPLAQAQEHHDQSARVYQDTKHKDTHEWNNDEDQQYRTYLKEHHKNYKEFSKASKKEQNDYWDWRHQH